MKHARGLTHFYGVYGDIAGDKLLVKPTFNCPSPNNNLF